MKTRSWKLFLAVFCGLSLTPSFAKAATPTDAPADTPPVVEKKEPSESEMLGGIEKTLGKEATKQLLDVKNAETTGEAAQGEYQRLLKTSFRWSTRTAGKSATLSKKTAQDLVRESTRSLKHLKGKSAVGDGASSDELDATALDDLSKLLKSANDKSDQDSHDKGPNEYVRRMAEGLQETTIDSDGKLQGDDAIDRVCKIAGEPLQTFHPLIATFCKGWQAERKKTKVDDAPRDQPKDAPKEDSEDKKSPKKPAQKKSS